MKRHLDDNVTVPESRCEKASKIWWDPMTTRYPVPFGKPGDGLFHAEYSISEDVYLIELPTGEVFNVLEDLF